MHESIFTVGGLLITMKKSLFLTLVLALASVVTLNASDLKFMALEDLSYDDNIYLRNGGRVGSGIASTKVGALLDLAIPNTSLEGKASATVGYNAYTKNNGTNGFWDALVAAEVGNEMLKIGDRFMLTSDPANSELTDRAQRVNNNIYASYRTNTYKKLSVGAKVSDELNKYTGFAYQALNRNNLNIGLGAYYNISEKTSLLAEYTYHIVSYQKTQANNSNGGTLALGIEGQVAPKVTGEAKVTYNYRNYTHEVTGYDDYANLIGYDLAFTWEPTSQNLVRLSGSRNFEETFYANNRYFVSTGVKLYGSQKIMDKFTAGLTLGYENLSYAKDDNNGVKRSDDVITVRPEVNYQFKEWLSAGVWYQYRRRASNAGADNFYFNNRVGAFVKAIF